VPSRCPPTWLGMGVPPTEPLAASMVLAQATRSYLAGVQGVLARRWGSELQAPVRTGLVVMVDVLGEHGLEMAPEIHEKMRLRRGVPGLYSRTNAVQ